jgi:hypothetical protein
LTTEMGPGLLSVVIHLLDSVAQFFIGLLVAVLPTVGSFDFSEYVASSFNIGGAVLAQCVCQAAGFLLPVFLAGYLFLKMREVAR